jgi:hypothetical protein
MSEAVDLAKLHGPESIERALAACAKAGRFGDGDLAAILAHQARGEVIEFPTRASERSEAASMQRSTAAWEGFGR